MQPMVDKRLKMEDVLEYNPSASDTRMTVISEPESRRALPISSGSSSSSQIGAAVSSPATIDADDYDDRIIRQMARSGVPTQPWAQVLGPLLERNIIRCLDIYRAKEKASIPQEDYDRRRNELRDMVRGFFGAPFTLQRICELILTPQAHYRSVDALLRGFEVLLSISSTIPVASAEEVARLESEYERVVASSLPGRSPGSGGLRRSDTVEMDVDLS